MDEQMLNQLIGIPAVLHLVNTHYNISGECTPLPGEVDLNFRINAGDNQFVLKISRPDVEINEIDFQLTILNYLSSKNVTSPEVVPTVNGENYCLIKDDNGQTRCMRLISWIDGKPWSAVNPVTDQLRFSLGSKSGGITEALQGYSHQYAGRHYEWDNRQAAWVKDHISQLDNDLQTAALFFVSRFEEQQNKLQNLRTSVIHNDANDNNIIVNEGEVAGLIDFGDSVYSWTINDAAVALAYLMMGQEDPLSAARPFLSGYHQTFALEEKELEVLYLLVGIRLVISLTKSTINLKAAPHNTYLQISREPAINLLLLWHQLSPSLAEYTFRAACGYSAFPAQHELHEYLVQQSCAVKTLLPELTNGAYVDMSASSAFLGNWTDSTNQQKLTARLREYMNAEKTGLLINGYGEARTFYTTKEYQREGSKGTEYRTIHLGVDFWAKQGTAVHAPLAGRIHAVRDNRGDKNYGPTVIIAHEVNNLMFYSLYGHLSRECLERLAQGDEIRAGELLGFIGNYEENGGWSPHLHFQLIGDMLDYTSDFPGVAYPSESDVWLSMCPDPGLLFSDIPVPASSPSPSDLLAARKQLLGPGMSVSYESPLMIVRGAGAYLINEKGQKFLDTVNNVAHVGHEHPRVVRAGQAQMAVLNTNTRYLHPGIIEFSRELLSTFPPELCVVHLVNSGSEANELALRMAYTITGAQDMLALETGYHGNTTGTISVSSYKFDSEGGKGAPPTTHIMPMPDAYRGIYRGGGSARKYAGHADELLYEIRKKGKKPAGFIGESILSCGGQIVPPDGFLREVYHKVRNAGGVCIADEVQTGCGRTGEYFWSFQLHDVIPDIVTIGKPIGNGHPLGAVVCTREIANAFANGMEYFNTFGGNPVSSAIGLEVLRVIKDERLQENAYETGQYLLNELDQLKNKYACIGDIRGKGLFLGIELCTPDLRPLPDHAHYLVNRARELGILMSTDGPQHNVIKIKPPMVFSGNQASELLDRLEFILKEDSMQL